jgi:hypothetical protein
VDRSISSDANAQRRHGRPGVAVHQRTDHTKVQIRNTIRGSKESAEWSDRSYYTKVDELEHSYYTKVDELEHCFAAQVWFVHARGILGHDARRPAA